MVFVDGENLAIRYGRMLNDRALPRAGHVVYRPDIYVWSSALNDICRYAGTIRKHYYTSVIGDEPRIDQITEDLKAAGIEAPRVFKKTKDRGSKRVDISLATDMLTHAARHNFEIAVLVAGDEDYLPLVEAVQGEGRRVFVWFVEDGISPALRRVADRYSDLGELLFIDRPDPAWR
jgi:uncharacterized LabA/DUF88 family protein